MSIASIVTDSPRPVGGPNPILRATVDSVVGPSLKDARVAWGVAAAGYFALYLASLFVRLESEWRHWISLVLVPLAIVVLLRRIRPDAASPRPALEEFGLDWRRWSQGLVWAIPIGLALCALQFWASRDAALMLNLLQSKRAWTLVPTAIGLSFVTAGFTEEFFFRGFLQMRFRRLFRHTTIAIAITSFLFGLYHLPYAYLNPRWPSHGNWTAAAGAAFGQGIPGGVILGVVFHKSRNNLLASVTVHSLINVFPIALALARH